jgi:hypothetical protein
VKIGNFWLEDLFADDLFADGFWADQFSTPPIPTPAGIKARPIQPFAVIEVDIPLCTRTYGVAPCTAKLGGTVTVNVLSITSVFIAFHGYNFRIVTATPHNFVDVGKVTFSGIVATGDFDINGEHDVVFIESPTQFRVAWSGGFVAPTGSYSSGGSFVSSIANATGFKKCFNTIRTCQDRLNFESEVKTLRFAEPNGDPGMVYTKDSQPVVVIPSVQGISVTPSVLRPGIDIGQRETVRVSFRDHPHSDAGLDKYIDERDYDPFQQGTFWGKQRARHVSFEGFPLRLLRGHAGDDLSEATVYHYVVDGITGQAESVSISAKDFLTLTDQKKAQCPRISNGVLDADIDEIVTSITLLPIGVGDAEYPLSGKIAIGGEEVCAFTRSGDDMTIVRAQSGTEASEHKEGDIVQLVKVYEAQAPSDIIYNLLTEFTPGIDPTWIDAAEWQAEVDEYVGRLYSAEIAEPTSVVTLINELVAQVGLVFWADPVTQRIQLRSLRPVASGANSYDEDEVMPGLKIQEQTQLRISAVWTYYGQRNPLEPVDEPSNYRAAIASNDAKASQDYPEPAIKKIFSRWIASNNRAAAARLNSVQLSRYRDPPRKFSFELYSSVVTKPVLGGGYQITSWMLQDDTGMMAPAPIQITSLEPREDGYTIDAQEAIFVEQDELEGVKLIFIDDIVLNVNLRDLFDLTYLPPTSADVVRVIVGSTAIVGSNDVDTPSMRVGNWPEGLDLTIVVNPGGWIVGRGGNGGSVGGGGGAQAGGTALRTRFPIKIINNGNIAGGGGGGGQGQGINIGVDPAIEFKGAGGGGGSGHVPGFGGSLGGQPGTFTEGGEGGVYLAQGSSSIGGDGGAPGEAGATGNGPAGGAAGVAIDGESFVTYEPEGEIAGGRIN